MPSAKDYNPAKEGVMISAVGVPGSGKSYLAASALKNRKGFALLAPSSEVESYAGLDLDYEVVHDPEWSPAEGKWVATGFTSTMKVLRGLDEKPYPVYIVDTMSAIADVVGHSVLANSRVDNPQDLGNPFTFYVTLRNRMINLLDRLNYLRYKHKAHVIVNWHEDVKEVEGLGTPRKSVEGGKTVTHWDSAKTVLLAGSLRNDIGKWFGIHLSLEPVIGSKPFRCKMQALPTPSQPQSKTRLHLAQRIQALGELPNDFGVLEKLIEEEYGTA